MASADHPSKADIQLIFKKLRNLPCNKICFDCGANNPTWASVTYGVFLCIDCSAVHRSLGVHLSFIRSTQLDTNWTWIQLRAMQVGGNSNATTFFRQHGCTVTDAQQKYHSRPAQTYKLKLEQQAIQAMKLHGTKVHIDIHGDDKPKSPDEKEVDFFKEHTISTVAPVIENMAGMTLSNPQPIPIKNGSMARLDEAGDGAYPNVEHALSISPTEAAKQLGDRKPVVIGAVGSKKSSGLGAKKVGGLGAAKVKTDFREMETAAEERDREQERAVQQVAETKEKERQAEEQRSASMRLAYKDISEERRKQEEKLKTVDPKKAEQVERLGMGSIGLGNKGISHSALTGMRAIEQEGPASTAGGSSSSSALLSNRPFGSTGSGSSGLTMEPSSDFFQEQLGGGRRGGGSTAWERDASGWSGGGNGGTWLDLSTSGAGGSGGNGRLGTENDSRFGRSRRNEPTTFAASNTNYSETDEAQKKFGNAKAISSDAFFGKQNDDMSASLARFEGSTAISSDELFGRERRGGSGAYGSATPDLADIKEGVRQGVTKVAGKLSSLANGVVASLQRK